MITDMSIWICVFSETNRFGDGLEGCRGILLSFFQIKVNNIFVLVMYEEDNIAFKCENREADNFYNRLLDQKDEDKALCANQQEAQLKEAGSHLYIDHDQESNDQFPLRFLEKEDFNYLLPQKPFQEQGEEDMILIKTENKRGEEEISHFIRQQTKIDKIAYQEQTRAIKIDRYRDKKSRRKWDRKVCYGCRKLVADNRERVNGRFVKKSPYANPIESGHKNSLATGEMQIPKQLFQSSRFFEVEELFL